MPKEVILKITNPQVIEKLKDALKEFKAAADEDGMVDGDHLADVFSESDFDYNFVQDLLADAFSAAGALEKKGFDVKIVPTRIDEVIASL